MFSALLRKECRQARTLTLVGAALGLLLPLILYLFAGEEGDQRLLRAYTSRDVFFTLSPGLMALGLWPFWALMSGVQSFAGDLSDGTDRFLLDRPVPRTKSWLARLLTALGSVLLVVGASLIGWAFFSNVLGGFSLGEITANLVDSLTVGLIAALIAFALCGGILAASFGARSFAGVLLGAVLGAIFPAALYKLAGIYYFFALKIAVAGCIVLPLLLLVVSWAMLCRGEPAGRRRWIRGTGVLASAFLVLGVSTLVAIPLALRSTYYELSVESYFLPAQMYGDTVYVPARDSWTAGWLIDPVSGERLRFLPPVTAPVFFAPDGKTLAVMTDSGAWGSTRIELLNADGSRAKAPVNIKGTVWQLQDLFWRDEQLYLLTTGGLLFEVDHDRGELNLLLTLPGNRPHLVMSADRKTVYSVRVLTDQPSGNETENLGFFPLDLDGATLAAEPSRVVPGSLWNIGGKISPSGRYCAQQGHNRRNKLSVVDLITGEMVPLSNGYSHWRPTWLPEDRLAWIEDDEDPSDPRGSRRVMKLWQPGRNTREIRSWEFDAKLRITAEPHGNRLLITERHGEPDQPSSFFEFGILDPRTDAWQSLPTHHGEISIGRVIWAGQGRLIVGAGEETYLLYPDNPETLIPL